MITLGIYWLGAFFEVLGFPKDSFEKNDLPSTRLKKCVDYNHMYDLHYISIYLYYFRLSLVLNYRSQRDALKSL